MLRLKKLPLKLSNDNTDLSPSEPVSDKIYHDFTNDYLELIRLLQDAAGLEHLLMLQYLYAAFSIKDEYIGVRGSMGRQYYIDAVNTDLFGVAIEEMQHLDMVNAFLTALGASPNLTSQEFPFVSDIYPFALELKPISLYTISTYLFVEADNCALNLECAHTPEEIVYIEKVLAILGNTRTNHLGSLYNSIIEYSKRVSANPPAFLKSQYIDWNKYENNMILIIDQGEELHYQFFKTVFTATHPGFMGVPVWSFPPDAPEYPAIQFDPNQTTAFAGQEKEIKDPDDRAVGWLSDLHYWIIMSLLDLNYHIVDLKPKYKAVGNMTEALYRLGIYLSKKAIGLPFDPPSLYPTLGKNPSYSLEIIRLMVLEAQQLATDLKNKGVLNDENFNFMVYTYTLNGLIDEGQKL